MSCPDGEMAAWEGGDHSRASGMGTGPEQLPTLLGAWVIVPRAQGHSGRAQAPREGFCGWQEGGLQGEESQNHQGTTLGVSRGDREEGDGDKKIEGRPSFLLLS